MLLPALPPIPAHNFDHLLVMFSIAVCGYLAQEPWGRESDLGQSAESCSSSIVAMPSCDGFIRFGRQRDLMRMMFRGHRRILLS